MKTKDLTRRETLKILGLLGIGVIVSPTIFPTRLAFGASNKLTVAIAAKPWSLDPVMAIDVQTLQFGITMYDTLLKYDVDQRLFPHLAKSIPQSLNEKTLVCELRDNVKFHNGRPLTADDIKYNFEWIMNPDNKSPISKDLESIEKIEPLSKHKFNIILKRPYAPILEKLATLFKIVSREAREKMGKEFGVNPINGGTGPYRFVEYKKDNYIKVEKFDGYFMGGYPKIDEVIFRIIPEDATRIINLRTNTVDVISDFPVKDYERLKKTKGVEVGTVAGFEIEHIYFNNKNEPFSNKYLRLAVSHAIDRQVLIDQVFYGLGTNTFGGPISAGSSFFNPQVKELMYFDKQKAREYLKMAGKPNGFEFTLIMTDEERFKNQGIIIQSQLKDVGIKLNLSPMEKTAFFDKVRRFNYDAGLEDWLNLSVDRDTYLYWNYHSEGAYNWCGYTNPEIDQLLDASRGQYNLKERKKLFMKIQSILTQEQPMVWLSYRNNQEAWGNYVKNYKVRSDSLIDLTKVTIEGK